LCTQRLLTVLGGRSALMRSDVFRKGFECEFRVALRLNGLIT
jgi:hypothetical protein